MALELSPPPLASPQVMKVPSSLSAAKAESVATILATPFN